MQFKIGKLLSFAVNGNWGEWSSFSRCSVTCGEGTQTKTRTCNNPDPQYGGADCEGESEESQSCSADTTCPRKLPFTKLLMPRLLLKNALDREVTFFFFF